MCRINVCELVCDSDRWVYGAYWSLFSTLARHRWWRWLRCIPDDDHNEPSFPLMSLFSCWRDWQHCDTTDSQPPLGSVPSSFFEVLLPQKGSGACRFCSAVAGDRITARAPVRNRFSGFSEPRIGRTGPWSQRVLPRPGETPSQHSQKTRWKLASVRLSSSSSSSSSLSNV